MPKRVSAVLKLWKNFSTRQPKKQQQCPRSRLRNAGLIFRPMLRLVRAHQRAGEYDQVPDNALLWVVAALNYLIDPIRFDSG